MPRSCGTVRPLQAPVEPSPYRAGRWRGRQPPPRTTARGRVPSPYRCLSRPRGAHWATSCDSRRLLYTGEVEVVRASVASFRVVRCHDDDRTTVGEIRYGRVDGPGRRAVQLRC